MPDSLTPIYPDPAPQPPDRAPETDAESLARAFEMFREIAELGLRAARVAVVRIEANESNPDSAEPAPSLTFARATHAARQAIAFEQRLRAGIAAPSATPARAPSSRTRSARPPPLNPLLNRDPRRALLRDALRKAAQREPDRSTRAQLCRFIDERVDAELADDPDAAIPIAELLMAISEEIGLHIELSRLPGELLGIAPIRPPGRTVDLDDPAPDTG